VVRGGEFTAAFAKLPWPLVVTMTCTNFTSVAGRNENAQLGQGDTVRRDVPTLIDSLSGLSVVRVACGKAHTLFLTGMLLAYLLVFDFLNVISLFMGLSTILCKGRGNDM